MIVKYIDDEESNLEIQKNFNIDSYEKFLKNIELKKSCEFIINHNEKVEEKIIFDRKNIIFFTAIEGLTTNSQILFEINDTKLIYNELEKIKKYFKK